MYILIEIEHIAKEETATVKWLDAYQAYDEAVLAMDNAYAGRMAACGVVNVAWTLRDEMQAHVNDEFCNSWDWMVFGTEGTSKTFAIDPFSWGAED